MIRTSLLTLIALVPLAAHGTSADWPRFLGAASNHSDAHGVPLTWSESEHVKWRTELPGEGWSSPVVQDGQVWMTTATEEGKSLRVLCADFATGKLLHDVEVFHNETVPPKHQRNSYASPTPILENGRLYVHFGAMGTACVSTRDAKKIWERRDLPVNHQNGPGGSATLWQDRLLIACDGMDAQYEVALDKLTGRTLWRTERSGIPKLAARPADMRKAYGTPVVIDIDGRATSLTTGAERLYAIDPKNGQELWFVDYPGFSNVPLPVNGGAEHLMSLALREAREIFEREYLLAQINRFGGNISRTAEFVGMERSALHRKLRALGVSSDQRLGDVKTA